jgi:hypothetical protein
MEVEREAVTRGGEVRVVEQVSWLSAGRCGPEARAYGLVHRVIESLRDV